MPERLVNNRNPCYISSVVDLRASWLSFENNEYVQCMKSKLVLQELPEMTVKIHCMPKNTYRIVV